MVTWTDSIFAIIAEEMMGFLSFYLASAALRVSLLWYPGARLI